MKWHNLLLTLGLLLIHIVSPAQVQWFQNQDGNNPYPNGTIARSVHSLTTTSFVANYLWHIDNDQYTWKISKTHINGNEQRTFFVTGTTSQTEVRTGRKNSIYVLHKDYPYNSDPQYSITRLDSNLVVRGQRTFSFPGGYAVYNFNAFKLDEDDNVYIAGDGQYPDGPGFLPASFVMKTDRYLNTSWIKMDSAQTFYSDLHIDGNGFVWIVEDHYETFPNINVTKRANNGQLKWKKTIALDPGRFSLSSAISEDDHLLLYGAKMISDDGQAIYLAKINRANGGTIYNKTHFPANGIQLSDMKLDKSGNIFTLVTQYFNSGQVVCRVDRLSSWNGAQHWTRRFIYSQDSCNLTKLVVNNSDRFYVIGERKTRDILSRGFSQRIKKNGQLDGTYSSPDSVSFQRSHWLIDGITDKNNDLISIGNTQDFDTLTFQSSYLRSFAVKIGKRNNNHPRYNDCDDRGAFAPTADATETVILPGTSPVIYPNPVMNEVNIGNLADGKVSQVILYNLQGKEMIRRQVNATSTSFDVSKFPGGVYLLKVNEGTTQRTLRFVISR